MRTLSARIIVGFAVLTIAFGVITATVVVNMSLVEDRAILISSGFVPLALESKDLHRTQENLIAFLDEQKEDPLTAQKEPSLLRLRRVRDNQAVQLRGVLTQLDSAIELDPKQLASVRQTIDEIDRAIAAVAPLYDRVFAGAKPDAPPEAAALALSSLQVLKRRERETVARANNLAQSLEGSAKRTGKNLQKNEALLRQRTTYLGLLAVVLGLLITAWIVITLRPLRRLRDGARRIAAGDYASRIPEKGPAEIAGLAREFNSMARAIEDRERELVRSERLAAVGKMAAMIAHEVRNPLSSLGLNTELLEEELTPEASEARALCHAIHREVDRLAVITEEYLAFSRLPKPKLADEPVNAMVGALAAFVREDLAIKQVTLTTDLAPAEPVARIDAAQIRQCLINLIRNAAEAVHAKGNGHVTLRTRSAGPRIEIDVEDNGVGIPADVLPQLFDPFFSTKEDGSGLGLALTQQIVRDHGGDLRVDSLVGRGTTFTVSVPIGG